VSNNAIKEKSLLNYHIQYRRISVLFLVSITLVSSSLYILPLAYSQEFSYIPNWRNSGTGEERLLGPAGIAIDQQGDIYVADTSNNRIQVFSDNGTFITQWGAYGTGNGTLKSPEGIALDQQGNVYVADTANHRIQVFSDNGTFITQWGGYGLTDLHLRSPEGIAVHSSGNVYVADTANRRIVALSPSPLSSVAFSSEDGQIYGNDTRIKIEPIYDGLQVPTDIAFLGPDDMLVLQKDSKTIMRIVNGQMLDEPVLDLGDTITRIGCMCSIAILQNDNSTSYAFLYYFLAGVAEDNGTTKLVNSLYRYDITNGKFTNPKLIFEMPSSLGSPHNGGKVMVGPDNNIYLSIGEIYRYKTKAQNVNDGPIPDGSSSILRFTPNGDPVDGGLLGNVHPMDKYYAYGIRNSFGLDYDPITGNIWMTDNGPTYSDEINIVRPGFNGGWNKIMGMSSFANASILTELELFNGTGKYYDPIFDWHETIGVTDLVFVPGDKLGKEYEGNLLVGDIKAGYLYRYLLNQSRTGLLLNGSLSDGVANNNVENLEAAFARIKEGGITDLEIGPDGLVYIVSSNGKIMRLEPMDTNATLPLIETNGTDTAPIGTNETDTNATGAGETGGVANSVSIVSGSSTLTTDAYEPNPAQVSVSVGGTVTWTNDDSQPHTVTSGQDADPDGLFDSDIMAPAATFEHTFTEAGEYPYFCLLHPNMVGTVNVTS
jgi:aldose sugar dehydrogenase